MNRYKRQILLPEVGVRGQERLKNSRILIVGMGGLGCPAAQYLATMGIGELILSDSDLVEESNLNRQILYGPENLGQPKVDAAAKQLLRLRPDLVIQKIPRLTESAQIGKVDVIVDGTDSLKSRQIVHHLGIQGGGIPTVYAAIHRFEGQLSVFQYQQGPCLKCLYPGDMVEELVPNCSQAGVLGVLPGVLGTMQAVEVIKILLGQGDILSGKVLLYDSLAGQNRSMKLNPRAGCECRGLKPKAEELDEIEVEDWIPATLKGLGSERRSRLKILDVREDFEISPGSRLDGSIHIPLSRLFEGERPNLRGEYLVVCRVGLRSRTAAALLNREGNAHCHHLQGGLMRYLKEVKEILNA